MYGKLCFWDPAFTGSVRHSCDLRSATTWPLSFSPQLPCYRMEASEEADPQGKTHKAAAAHTVRRTALLSVCAGFVLAQLAYVAARRGGENPFLASGDAHAR